MGGLTLWQKKPWGLGAEETDFWVARDKAMEVCHSLASWVPLQRPGPFSEP